MGGPAMVTENFAVSAQIQLADIPALKAAGFTALICNRPDGEDIDQPDHASVEAAALAAERMALNIAIPPPADRDRARIGASNPRVIAMESVSSCADAAIAVAASPVTMFKLSLAMPNDQNPVIHA